MTSVASWGRLSRPLAAALRAAEKHARERGLRAYAVGGCVRDWLLGRSTKDLDLVLESDPEPLARFCAERGGARLEAFDRFGTFRVLGPGGLRIDFVRARAETYPAPAALPVVRPGTLQEDLARRDFSINALAAPLGPAGFGEIVDPLGGRGDLDRKALRVLHDRSFEDDPTRAFRAARFTCRFGFRLEAATAAQLRRMTRGNALAALSRERLRGELLRILEEREPLCPLRRLADWGLAHVLQPGLPRPARLAAGRTALERLGLLALSAGPRRGAELVRSLHLERADAQALLSALEVAARRSSPRAPLTPLAAGVLRIGLRREASRLRPLLLSGGDLSALGLAPGPAFSVLLDRAARAQWAGAFSDRAGARRWLRRAARVPSHARPR